MTNLAPASVKQPDWILAAAKEIVDWVGDNHSAFHKEHVPEEAIAAIIAKHASGILQACEAVIKNYDEAQEYGICDEEHWEHFDGVDAIREALKSQPPPP